MTTGHVFIATSLDGFIAREDGAIDWLMRGGSSQEDHGYNDFIAGIDAIVMGRGSYETVRGFDPWPYALPVLVLSRQLAGQAVPEDLVGKVRFSDLAPTEAMRMLAAEGARRVYVDGGQVVQSFLRAGLIEDIILTRIPVLIGQGRPLFGQLKADLPLIHETTRSFPSGLVQSRYRLAA